MDMKYQDILDNQAGINLMITGLNTKEGESKITDIDDSLYIADFVEEVNRILKGVTEIRRGINAKYSDQIKKTAEMPDGALKDVLIDGILNKRDTEINNEMEKKMDFRVEIRPVFSKEDLKKYKLSTMALVACKKLGLIKKEEADKK